MTLPGLPEIPDFLFFIAGAIIGFMWGGYVEYWTTYDSWKEYIKKRNDEET